MKLPTELGPVHFVGIGGIGMSGIAEVLVNLGYRVQGSDAAENANVLRLRATGVPIAIGHDAANLGEALRPLARVASGGETARLMLAIKSILAGADATPTLVFDEVDTGVGGRSGQVVGEKLWSLTNGHQVLVITHLAQIAAFGDAHFRIAKHDREGITLTDVHEITGDERVAEIAEMLAGEPPSPATLKSATELLDVAATWKLEAQQLRAV